MAGFFRAKGNELQVEVVDNRGTPMWVDVPPIPARMTIARDFHDTLGHLGREKLLEALKEWYWWPGMAADAAQVLRTCEACCKDRKGGEPGV